MVLCINSFLNLSYGFILAQNKFYGDICTRNLYFHILEQTLFNQPLKSKFLPMRKVKLKALTRFKYYPGYKFCTKVSHILLYVKSSPKFSPPVTLLEEIEAANKEYSSALIAAERGYRESFTKKNEKRAILEGLVKSLCGYINYIAQGDHYTLIISGFDVTKKKKSIPITKPEYLKLSSGENEGELKISIKAVKGAVAYKHQYNTDPKLPEDKWVSVTSTRCRNKFTNLELGKRYWCRVAALDKKGQHIFSDVYARIVV
jgi:hypothetical protein